MSQKDSRIGRRKVLGGSIAALTGAIGIEKAMSYERVDSTTKQVEEDLQNELPVNFKIVPDYRLDKHNRDMDRALEMMKKYTEISFSDLYERADIETEINVVFGERLEVSEGEDIEYHLGEFEDLLEDPASHGNLLLSTSEYEGVAGLANAGEGGVCGTSESHSRYGVVGMSQNLASLHRMAEYYLLEEDKTRVLRYAEEEDKFYVNWNPFRTLIDGLHELGHNLCLDHSHGEIRQVEERLISTPMMNGYTDDFLGEENASGKEMPKNGEQDWWQSIRFSDTAVEHIRSIYE